MAYLEITEGHSEPCVTLTYFVIFKILVYSEFWHIQNLEHIQNPGIFKTLAHSEPENIHNPWLFRTLGYSEPEAYSDFC